MSVQAQIDRIEQNVENTYDVLEQAGAVMPETRNSNNLPATAASISAVLYSKEQSLTEKQKAQAQRNLGVVGVITPQDYGAKGDNSTDDTLAFQNALAENRIVFVPGGSYKLSGELVIRDNCQVELAQDVVLNFSQASGNCVTLNRSAWLNGNHATLNVPYGFTGYAVNVDTSVHTAVRDVPPWTHWSPQWKTARYIENLNICMATEKTTYAGDVHESEDGNTYGTAVYIKTDGSATSSFIWGLHFSGLRIAGAFEYGIRAVNVNSGWNHEMRLEAYIDACKIGLSLEDCNKAFVSVVVQPRAAGDGTVYAKHGVQLIRSRDTDLSSSRIWDWDATKSLWTFDKTNINQHFAMYGDCRGTILNDYLYYHLPSGFDDIRELIYTDTQANFDSLIILQEPFTRWFKPVDGEPYFDNGDGSERLVMKKEQDALFQTDYIPTFTDRLATALDGAGGVYNQIGYKQGGYIATDGVSIGTSTTTTCTGFVACRPGSVIRVRGMAMTPGDGDCRIILYDSSFKKIMVIGRGNVVSNGSYYYLTNYSATEDGFNVQVTNGDSTVSVAYFRMNVLTSTVGSNPVIAVDEEIAYTQVGTLSSEIKVKSEQVYDLDDAIEAALVDAKASGDFKGDKGETGAQGAKGEKGDKGDTGLAGYTPVKGTDYWTAADKSAMVSDVLAALPTWNGGSY